MNPTPSTNKDHILKILFYSLLLSLLIVVALGVKFLLIPFLFSIILYYALHPAVDSLESFGIPRSLGIGIVFLVLGFIAYWIFNIYIPPAIDKVSPFLTYWSNEFQNPDGNNFSEQIEDLIPINSPLFRKAFPPGAIAQQLIEYATITVDLLAESLPELITILLITPIISFFILLDASNLYKTFISFIPNRYFEMTLMITHKINNQLTNYLKGVLIQSSIMTVIAAIGFYILGLNFFFLFAVFLGLANLVPYLGPAIGLVPPAIYALVAEGDIMAIVPVAIVVLICQLVDNIFVQPTVIAKSASLHPVLVLVGITVGGNLMGLWGMLIAIPVLSILKVTLSVLYKYLRQYGVLGG